MQEAQSSVVIPTTSSSSAPPPAEIVILDEAELARVVGGVALEKGPGGYW